MRLYLLFAIQILAVYSGFSQITSGNIEIHEQTICLKPEQLDSLLDFKFQEKPLNHKKYIGYKFYLHKINNHKINNYEIGAYEINNNADTGNENFLYSIQPTKLVPTIKIGYYDRSDYNNKFFIPIDTIVTLVYKPYYYYSSNSLEIASDAKELNESYFTVLDVFYGDKIKDIIRKLNESEYKFGTLRKDIYELNNVLFLLRNEKNGDSVYCTNPTKLFFVPFFTKQRELYLNKGLVYDDKKYSYGANVCPKVELFDARYLIKFENEMGEKDSTWKKVELKSGSRWICKDVTLLPCYFESISYYGKVTNENIEHEIDNGTSSKISYVLTNENNQQIILNELGSCFLTEKEYNLRELRNKINQKQLIENVKRTEIAERQKDLERKRKYLTDCVSKYGNEYGKLIANEKVEIGMTKEMCISSWGIPWQKKKATTANGTSEILYYGWGKILYINTGYLYRIKE